MKVAVCLPTRGRPQLVRHAIDIMLTHSVLEDTKIVVGFDNDDETNSNFHMRQDRKLLLSYADREDTLGAKWNRCAAQVDAELYVIWADDITIVTPGWDEKLAAAADLFNGGVGFVFFGNIPGTLQTGIGITRRYMDYSGFFCPPYFPYWWCDTWADEMARFTGRVVQADVSATLLQEIAGKSRGVRDVVFWGNFFQKTRPIRKRVAERIIREGDTPDWNKLHVMQFWGYLERQLDQRDSPNRDPETAKRFETQLGFDAPDDARYRRAKAAATAFLAELDGLSAVA